MEVAAPSFDQNEQERWPHLFPVLFFIALIGLMHLSVFRHLYEIGWADHGDGLHFCWSLWWLNESLLNLRQSPYFTPLLFSPTGISLYLHDLSPLYGVLSMPLQSFLPLEVIYSVLTESVFLASAAGAYLLCFEVSRNRRAALVGGVIYTFSPYILSFPGQLSIVSVQWLPLVLWTWLRAERTKSRRYAVFCGLFMVGSFYCCFTHTIFIVLSLAFFAVVEIVRSRSIRQAGDLAVRMLLVGLCVLLLTGPVIHGILEELTVFGNYTTRSILEAETNGIDLALTVVPRRDHPLWGQFLDLGHRARWIPKQHNGVFLGYIALLLSCLACILKPSRRSAWPWALFGLIMLVFSLGPSLLVAGHHPLGSFREGNALPFPYYFLTTLPVLGGMRVPARGMIMVFCALSVLSSLALATLIDRTDRHRRMGTDKILALKLFLVPWLLSLFVLIDSGASPRLFSSFDIPPLFSALSEKSNAKTVLYVPIFHLKGFLTDREHYFTRQILFFQTQHRHPYTSGQVSRRPGNEELMFLKPGLFSVIESIQNGDTGVRIDTDRLREELPFALALLNADTVVFDRKRFPLRQAPVMLALLRAVMPVPATMERDDFVVWRIPETIRQIRETRIDFLSRRGLDAVVPLSQLVDMKTDTPAIYRNTALTLSLPAAWSGPFTIAIDADCPSVPIEVQLRGDGVPLIQGRLESGLTVLSGEFPPHLMDTVRKLQLSLRETVVRTGFPPRTPTDGPPILCFSAGMDAGNESWISIGSEIVRPDTRGYFLVALRNDEFAVQKMSFDTHASAEESARMDRWLASLPEGTVVLGSVFDEASRYLTREAVESLGSIGCQADIRDRYRWSHAFIGQKGLLPGQAIESSSSGASCVHSNQGVKVPLRSLTFTLSDAP